MDSTAAPAHAGLPRWTLLALVPFDIPERFPIHWGAHGPNGWATRTFLGVYKQLIFGGGLAAWER
jgi:hypothetical protein